MNRAKYIVLVFSLIVASCTVETLQSDKVIGFDRYITDILSEETTKVQLDDESTVWTIGDSLSVFRSPVNEKFSFNGKTGDVRGTIVKDDSTTPGVAFTKSYALYPYDKDTFCETEGEIHYSFPSTQYYKHGSFALGSNVMVASTSGEFDNRLNFLNVCGCIWLKVVGHERFALKSIKLYGNNKEILAGPAIINTNSLQVNMLDNTLTELTLSFPDGFHFESDTVSFWIPLPPVTFTNGLTIELLTDKETTKYQSTAKKVSVARNHVVQMASFTPVCYGEPIEKVIVLFGDSITTLSVRDELQKLLNSESRDIIGDDGFTVHRVNWKVVLAGVSGEFPRQISARQGGVPVYLKGPFTIPANGKTDNLGGLYSTWNDDAEVSVKPTNAITFQLAEENTTSQYCGCSNPFMVNGILCNYDGKKLTRLTSGEEVVCSGEEMGGETWVRVYPYAAWKYRDAYFSTYQGTNGEYNHTSAEEGHTNEMLAKFYDAETDYSTSKKHLIIGYHNCRWTQATTDYFSSHYPVVGIASPYMDMLKVGTSRAEEIGEIIEAPLFPSELAQAKKGIWPAPWDRGDHIHMTTPNGYYAYGVCIYFKMKEMGWLDY